MTKQKKNWPERMRGRLESLPLSVILVVGLFMVTGTGAGGYYAYKTYDYIEHDNEFCFSCHLMQDPYELFAQSAHRDLGCKACHQPNMIERSSMGVVAIVENPDTISVHSEVPNDLCADCHIEGDPEKWTLVASSAGHRVHLESDDPELQGLQCVECHSSSLHQFAATDETCAQSGCHTESDVELGAMSDLTIHCAACHQFSAPVPDVDQAGAMAAMSPDQSTCLSCHAMRQLVEMPDPDPHENACAACHNPHEQATPEEADATCTAAGCHTEPMELSAMHQGLEESVVEDCMYCHQAHDFDVDGSDCSACHTEILQDDPTALPPEAYHPGGTAPAQAASEPAATVAEADWLAAHVASAAGPVRVLKPAAETMADDRAETAGPSSSGGSALAPGVGLMHSWGHPIPQVLDFRHSEHATVDCTDCHESAEAHGRVTVTTVTDCRSCHHAAERIESDGCAACHEDSGSTSDPYSVGRTLSFSTGTTVQRALPFDHGSHADEDCATCHTDGLELSASAVDCASCHEEHHEPTTDCMSCHVEPSDEAHVIETAHVTCSGAGCHTEAPFQDVPRTNQVCLSCHQDMVDHRPGGDCAECHALGGIGGLP